MTISFNNLKSTVAKALPTKKDGDSETKDKLLAGARKITMDQLMNMPRRERRRMGRMYRAKIPGSNKHFVNDKK